MNEHPGGEQQEALFDIEGPDEDNCVWICSSQGREVWCHNLGPGEKLIQKLSQWLAKQDDAEQF